MQVNTVLQQTAAGFDGAVTGMDLLELLQFKGLSRFTGRIAVERGGKTGLLFFRDGEVIHAELDQLEGKAAFDAIVVWGGGSFSVEPKVTTTRQTLGERLQFLLLDAVRIQDEVAAGFRQEQAATGAAPQQVKGVTVKDRLGSINGLTEAVLTTRQGEAVQSIGVNSESLVAQGMYLVTTSGRVGESMGLGAFKGAVIQGGKAHLVVLEGPKNYLFAEVAEASKPSVVESEIRRALSGQN
ncbi:MAG: DUF4388 domain-containing protein [Trichlorobacter sp.]